VVEQVPQPDPPAVANPARKQLADTVVEPELVLCDELHDDSGDEALRDAADPERVVGTSLSSSGLGLA